MKYQPTPDAPGKIAFNPRQAGSNLDLIKEQNERDRRDMEVVKATMDANSETAKRNARNQEFNNRMKDKEFEKLMTFSKTAMEFAIEENNKKNEAEMQEGIAMAYTDGIGEEAEQGLEAFEAQLKSDDQETQAAGGLVFDQSNNYEVSSRVKGLSGWRQYGYQQGMAQRAGTEYQGYVANAMENDNETQITVNGITFTPATANGAAQVQAAMAAVRNNFVKEYGLIGTDVAVLNKYTFPGMRKAESALMGDYTKRFAEDESYAEQTEAKAAFAADGDFGALITRLSNTLGPNGKRLGNRGGHDMAKKFLTESIQLGNMGVTEAEAINDQRVPWDKKGRTFGEMYPNLVRDAVNEAYKYERGQAEIQQRQDALEAQEAEEGFIKRIYSEPPGTFSADDIAEWQTWYAKRFGKPSSKLEAAGKAFSIDAVTKKNQRENLQELRSTGRLMPYHLRGVHPDLWNEFNSTAQQNAKARKPGGSYTASMKSIASTVKDARKDTTGDNGLKIETQMIVADLQDKFQTQVAKNIADGMSETQAEQSALENILNYFIEQGGQGLTADGKVNRNGRYFYDPKGGRDNFRREMQRQNKNFDRRSDDIKQSIQANGFEETVKTEGAIFDAEELEAMEKDYGTPGWQPPAMATWLGAQYKKDPYAIINAQREAAGLDPLESPSGAIVEGMTPQGRALLNTFKSQYRSQRAFSRELSGWDPAMDRHGEIIDRVAPEIGVEPGAVAAMIEIESSGKANNISYNGSSYGLMQINRDAHPEFFAKGDWADPEYNIRYGAAYLKQMIDRYGGNLEHAAMAYNGGPGSMDAYLAGTLPDGPIKTEMINHGRKFMKALSRYNRKALNNPLTRRGEFEVRQIVSTDPRYANDNDPSTVYDPSGHGGDAMHQHYEFATQRQAKLAKALYESKGFRVTSYLRPHDHGSAHQHGYAIDVAPPLDLARNDQAEMEWIDKANAVIGY